MSDDHPPPAISRKVVPPHWFVALLLCELLLDRWFPVGVVIPRPWSYLGIPLGVAGVLLGGWAFVLFRRAKTGLVPFSEASALVIAGPFRVTRNPMYVGMASALLGVAVVFGSITPLVAPVAFVIIITRLFILPEEAQMERTFGSAYSDFRKSVRRWL